MPIVHVRRRQPVISVQWGVNDMDDDSGLYVVYVVYTSTQYLSALA